MDARYLEAATVLPRQDKVCGRTLRAFCLRHRVCLEAIGSPFLDFNNKQFTAKDVVIASRILSTHDMEEMVKPFSFMDNLNIFILNRSKKRLLSSIAKIIGVMAKSCSYPKLWKKKSNRTSDNVPWPLACVANLNRHGATLEEAWTMPEGEAIWLSIAHSIYEGSKIDILSTDEEKELENFDAKIEAYKRKNNIAN